MDIIVSTLPAKYSHEYVNTKMPLDGLTNLGTDKNKADAPLWSLCSRHDRVTVDKTFGFVFDIDHKDYDISTLNQTYHYFYHKTHSDKYRLIIPFKKPVRFNNETFSIAFEQSLETLWIDTKLLDMRCKWLGAWFYYRPTHHPLKGHRGKFYTPPDIKPNRSPHFTRPRQFDELHVSKLLLKRINQFYKYYKTHINWEYIFTTKCPLGLHDDDTNHDIDFNEPNIKNGFQATIYCHHSSCQSRLEDIMQMFQSDNKKDPIITSYTVLYLTYSIISGINSIDQVEACGLPEELLQHINRIYFFSLRAKADTPVWLKYIHDNLVFHNLSMYEYKDGYYQVKNDDVLKNYYQYVVGTYVAYRTDREPKSYIDNMLIYAKAEAQKNYQDDDMINDGLCLKNGVLIKDDQTHLDYRPHDKRYFLTEQMGYNYDPEADAPLWKQTLVDYFDDLRAPQVQILQEFFGYCLTFDNRFEKFLIMFGISRGGKNTIAETLLSLVGGVASKFSILAQVDKRYFLIGKKITYINEVVNCNNEENMNELKRMVSTDPMEIKPLYKEVINLKEKPKIILAFNDAPDNLKIDNALRNRMLTLKFTKTFSGKENPSLKDDLQKELSGILNWALEGYHRLYTNKRFTECEGATTELYASANREVLEMSDFIQTVPEGFYTPQDLLDRYMQDTGDYKMSPNKLGRILRKLSITKKRKYGETKLHYEVKHT